MSTFGLVTLVLFLIFCILLLFYSHTLNMIEFFFVLWILVFLALYAHYSSKRIIHEEHFTEEEDSSQQYCNTLGMQKACDDQMRGYVTFSIWEKLKALPSKMTNNIMPHLKSLTSSLTGDGEQEPKDTDNTLVDFARVEQEPALYFKLGVFKDKDKMNIEDIDTRRLDEIEKDIKTLNKALFYIKKADPILFQNLQTFFLDDNK